jgi:hypothetical protein
LEADFVSKPLPRRERDGAEYDPVFFHSRREAIVIFCVWLTGLIWAVPFCYLNGYVHDVDPQTFPMIWGIPRWLFWGIFVPWIVADIFTTWFCFRFMADDDLGGARPGGEEAVEARGADEEADS